MLWAKNGKDLVLFLVLGRDTLQGNDKVLEGPRVLSCRRLLSVHGVVECNGLCKQVVTTCQDTEDSEREEPYSDDGDDTGVARNEPTEKGEESGDDIDSKDSSR